MSVYLGKSSQKDILLLLLLFMFSSKHHISKFQMIFEQFQKDIGCPKSDFLLWFPLMRKSNMAHAFLLETDG